MSPLDKLKKFIKEKSFTDEPIDFWTDEQLQQLVEAVQPDFLEEEQLYFQSLTARNERLKHELEEARKRLLESRMPPHMPMVFVP
jgi:hypothetical protein